MIKFAITILCNLQYENIGSSYLLRRVAVRQILCISSAM